MRLENKHVLFTGGSGGIGATLTEALLGQGAKVTVLDMIEPKGPMPANLRFAQCDLSDETSIHAALAKARDAFGQIDVLLHIAAFQPAASFEETSFASWRKSFAVNVDGFYHLVQSCMPDMRNKGWGRIVAFTSTTFNEGTPEHSDYVASKAALIGATRVMAREFGQYGITVNTLSPGLTKTEMAAQHVAKMVELGHPNYFDLYIGQQSLKRSLVPADYIGPVLFLITEDSAAISGQTLIVDGGKEFS